MLTPRHAAARSETTTLNTPAAICIDASTLPPSTNQARRRSR